MGSNCCKCGPGAVQESEITLSDLQDKATDVAEMEMEGTGNDDVPSQQEEMEEIPNDDMPSLPEPPIPTLSLSEVLENPSFVSVSSTEELPRNLVQDGLSGYRASNILWSSGSFSEPIPNGFYSVIPDDRMKLFKSIPTLDELCALGDERIKADVILVDLEKDIKLNRLKQWLVKRVEGVSSNPVKAFRKIGELVADHVHIGTKSRSETTQSFESHGFPLLGKIRHSSCRVRAILFKVLADAASLESKLVMGCPDHKSSARVDSYNHMSVVVMINTVEMMVDLKGLYGALIPMSSQANYMDPISVAGKHSCHSPLEPNSPTYGYMDRIDHESLSQSQPNIITELLPRSLNIMRKQRTANSSPEYPYVRARERFKLNGDKQSVQQLSNAVSRSVGATSEPLKQSRFSKERGDDEIPSCSPDDRTERHGLQENLCNNFPDYNIWKEVLESPMFQNKPFLPNQEWNIDFSKVKVRTLVGKGFSAKVFRGTWNGTEVAIKMFTDQEVTVENIKDFCNEIYILSQIRHRNVIMFHGACTKPPQLSLITEYVEKGSLHHLLHSSDEMKNLSWREIINMLRDICRGLMCIHQKGIVHRDLKSANCLLSNDWTVKICDFGLSRMMESGTVNDTVPAGTPQWVAPEVIRSEPFSEKCDIFSFGVIMWELCTLSKPWEGVPLQKVVNAVANERARLEIPEGPLDKLIADCWLEEPEQRPNCVDILTYLATCEDSLS